MSMISELVDRLRVESKSMGKYGVDYMATLLMRSADTIEMLSKKAREPKRGEWIEFDTKWGRSLYYCTNCMETSEVPTVFGNPLYDFCPNCGADMREREGE